MRGVPLSWPEVFFRLKRTYLEAEQRRKRDREQEGPQCPSCRLPLDVRERASQADEEAEGEVTCWICEACGLPAWGWDWDDDGDADPGD